MLSGLGRPWMLTFRIRTGSIKRRKARRRFKSGYYEQAGRVAVKAPGPPNLTAGSDRRLGKCLFPGSPPDRRPRPNFAAARKPVRSPFLP